MTDKGFGKGRELLELETVQRAIDEAGQWAGTEHARRFRGFARAMIGYTSSGAVMESPIEAIFWAWFEAANTLEDRDVYAFNLTPQQAIATSSGKKYRFDFVIEFGPQITLNVATERNIPAPNVAIELDGHDFHERTKEQVISRNERDREAQAEGWTILRFSGSELHRDPLKCVQAVIDICKPKADEWSQMVHG